MIEIDKICELRVICRNNSEGKYPFTIYTMAKYFYTSLAAAEAAIPGLVEKYASQEWMSVYRYVIYTFEPNTEITEMDRGASDVAVYLPDGSRWIRTDAKTVLRKGEIYEHIDAANQVYLCILEKEAQPDNTCEHLVVNCDYTKGWSCITDIMPCTYPVSREYLSALKSKLVRHDEVEQGKLTKVGFGLYSLPKNDKPNFIYRPSEEEKNIAQQLKKKFPLVDFCVWQPSVLAVVMISGSGQEVGLSQIFPASTTRRFSKPAPR